MSNEKEKTFWADQAASEIVKAGKGAVVATGISPSGHIHVGNMREVVTADCVFRALAEQGVNPKFVYIADTYDPLRRVYPFLDAEKFQPHVGRPLSEIPSPSGKEKSYAEEFLQPFLDSLKQLDIRVELIRADEMYKEGKLVQNIFRALEGTEKIKAILKEETGKETSADWSPFQPICQKCLKITDTTVTGFRKEAEEIDYKCECGDEGTVKARGGGKLTWRVDWPARWEMLQVTVEPFGKDHASKGGSYDTGVRICREVFDYEPPFPIVYEWIGLRGGGDMSSSKGNVISIAEMLKVVPPDVLKYAVAKAKPNRSIVFDPGLPMVSLIDEYDDLQSPQRHARAAEISKVEGASPVGVPFRHMVSLVQVTQDNLEKMVPILERNDYTIQDRDALASRAAYARKWLDRFAPENLRFTIADKLPESAKDLDETQKAALVEIAGNLKEGMPANEIHELIYKVKTDLDIPPAKIFAAIYQVLLGKAKGPRAGFFLASLEADFVKTRFQEAAQG